MKFIKNDDRGYTHFVYTLHYKDMDRTFVFMEYSESKSRSTEYRPVHFVENLKEQFKTAYQNVEQVYTSQVVGSMIVE